MVEYIPEYDYSKNGYKPLRKPFTDDQCGHCRAYYKMLYDKGVTKVEFPPQCSGHILDQVRLLKPGDFDSQEDFEEATILMDPVSWAQQEFGWEHRWYQEFVSSCTARMKILRGGRRSGKSRVEIILILYELMTVKNARVLLLCPSEKLIGEFFEVVEEYIKSSVNLKNSIERNTKNPHLLKLKNGSKLLGLSISPNDPKAGDKARGFDATMFVIDEAETFRDKDMEVILALVVSSAETKVMISSTPKGWRKSFYRDCTNKDIGYKEFWWISAEKPDWDDKMEEGLKIKFSESSYTQEFLADFGDLEEGVFKKKYLDAALQKYDMESISPERDIVHILGVDWNKSAGNHLTILRAEGNNLRLVKKLVIPESEYMQTASVENIINLHREWRFKHIIVDYGYGNTQVEMLKRYGIENPGSGLLTAIKGFHMNQYIDVIDPLTGLPEKKPAKPFFVMQTVKLLEDGNLILPHSEDYGISASDLEEGALENIGLVEQMRNFKVQGYSTLNLPRFSQGYDHTLTAFMLACGGYVLYEGALKKMDYSTRVVGIATPTQVEPIVASTTKEREELAKKGDDYILTNTFGRVPPTKHPPSTRDLNTLLNKRPGGQGRSRSNTSWKKRTF